MAKGSAVAVFGLHPGIADTAIGEHFGGRATAFYACFGEKDQLGRGHIGEESGQLASS